MVVRHHARLSPLVVHKICLCTWCVLWHDMMLLAVFVRAITSPAKRLSRHAPMPRNITTAQAACRCRATPSQRNTHRSSTKTVSIMPRGQRWAKAPLPPEEEEENDDDEVDVANDAGRRTAASSGLADDDDDDDDEGGGGGGGGVGGGEEDEDDDEEEEDPDASVLRILLSTDNHLGYLERDPIRGRDSFAAFEEVLSLARTHGVDMVLLSGDLFHENKPSRKTLHAVST